MAPFQFPDCIQTIILRYGLDLGFKQEIEDFNLHGHFLEKLRESMDNRLVMQIAVTSVTCMADWPMARDEDGIWTSIFQRSREFREEMYRNITHQVRECKEAVMIGFVQSGYGKMFLRLQDMIKRRHALYGIIWLGGGGLRRDDDNKLTKMMEMSRTFSSLAALESTTDAIMEALEDSL